MKTWKYCISLLAALLCAAFLAGCAGAEEGAPQGGGTGQGREAGQGGASQADGSAGGRDAAEPAGGAAETETPDGGRKRDLLCQRVQVMDASFEAGFVESQDGGNYGTCLGAQLYQGEPVIIWGYPANGVNQFCFLEDGTVEVESVSYPGDGRGVYLRRTDGSDELLVQRLPDDLFPGGTLFLWWLDRDGGLYCASDKADESGRNFFLKLDADGDILYKTYLEPGWCVRNFCQAPDGTMYLGLETPNSGREDHMDRLAAFDPGTGAVSEEDTLLYRAEPPFYDSKTFVAGEDGIYAYGSFGYQKVDTEDGTLSDYMMFAGTTYSPLTPKVDRLTRWAARDRYVYADGRVEILWTVETVLPVVIPESAREDSNEAFKAYMESYRSSEGIHAAGKNYEVVLDTLQWMEDDRIPVTVRGENISSWLKDQAVQFNRQNAAYQVVLEDLSSSNAADAEDYARQTSVEMASGKGPDILCGNLMEDYIQGLLDKGALLELGGLMEASGIREEDYLPAAFDSRRDGGAEGGRTGIYGIDVFLYPLCYKIRRDVLGGADEADIHTLMEALSGREGEAVYYGRMGADGTLRMFLEGSEDLWGTVDWGQGACDFSGGLFAQILENAGRYGYDGRHKCQNLVQASRLTDVYRYDSPIDLEEEGMAVCGVLFDDGCRGAADSRGTLSVNAGSAHKEGAWEFLCFLLGDGVQSGLDGAVPVKRAVLDRWLEGQLEEVAGGRTYMYGDSYIDYGEPVKVEKSYTSADMTQERVEGYLAALEDVRHLPHRTGPILAIIYEEAGAYFSGSRSLEDVVKVIQNRVQLYLDEQ